MTLSLRDILGFIFVVSGVISSSSHAANFFTGPLYRVDWSNPTQGGNFSDFASAIEFGEGKLQAWSLADCELERKETFNGFVYDGIADRMVYRVDLKVIGPGNAGNPNCGYSMGWQWFYRINAYSRAESIGESLGEDRCKPKTYCGNPINVAIGNKYEKQTDIANPALSFSRHYNSRHEVRTDIVGSQWTHTYSRRLVRVGQNSQTSAVLLYRPSGGFSTFTIASDEWANSAAPGDVLSELKDVSGTTIGWRFRAQASREIEEFDGTGRLSRIYLLGQPASLVSVFYSSYSPSDPAYSRIAFVEDTYGRRLNFQYSETGRLSRLVTPDAQNFDYTYDSLGRLVGVSYPDGHSKVYTYAESEHSPTGRPSELTGIFDELSVRYATFKYDFNGPISTEHAGGVEKFSVAYDVANSPLVTDPLGASERRTFALLGGIKKVSSVIEQCQGCTPRTTSYSYDVNGNVDVVTDPRGFSTDYDYDVNGLIEKATESANSPATKRTVETDWHADFPVPSERRTYDSSAALVTTQAWSYNGRGQVLSQTQTDPATSATRTTTTTYCEETDIALPNSTCPLLGLVKSVDGLRTDVSDVTTFSYYPSDDVSCSTAPSICPRRKGDLWKVTNPFGHVTETLDYDGMGRVLRSKDANGVVTDFEYHARGWLTARKVRGTNDSVETDDAITRIEYWPTGLVKRVIQPDGDFLDYEYDGAHRLTAIEDALGNRVEYTLDAAGNRTAEITKDDTGAITRQLSRVYDTLSRLDQALNAQSQVIADHAYDANGNLESSEDALGIETRQEYDPLDRLKKTIQDYGGLGVQTDFAYDPLDRLTRVTDPKGLHTDYAYNGLGDLTHLTSPDTGTTIYTYDSAGNRLTQTDARGVTATYAYDALNRLTGITYPDATQNIAYHYDEPDATTGCSGSFSTGRLTRFTDASGSTTYCYDRRGNITRKTQVTGSLSLQTEYGYTLGDRVSSITYPSGGRIRYVRDAAGQIDTIDRVFGLTTVDIVDGTTFLPFGPLEEIDFVNAGKLILGYDSDYAIQSVGGSALAMDIGTSLRGEVDGIEDLASGVERTYVYDPLQRLTDVQDARGSVVEAFDYDGTGNRLSKQVGSTIETYGYDPASHRLASIDAVPRTSDAMGSLTDRGDGWTFEYDDRQRLHRVKNAGAIAQTNTYNARGERVAKQSGAGPNVATTTFNYDEAGRLLSEYRNGAFGSAALQKEYVWLDDRPVAVVVHAGAYAGQILQIHSDHLGTPRALTTSTLAQTVVWRWDLTGSVFGEHAPEHDPDGDQVSFVFNLRYPGQYFDAESGLHYNYFRDFEASTGRYIQADPIGLLGGFSLYSYVRGEPLGATDALGLAPGDFFATRKEAEFDYAHYYREDSFWSDIFGDPFIDLAVFTSTECGWTWRYVETAMGSPPMFGRKPFSLGKFKGTDALRRENKVLNDAAKAAGLNKDQARRLHDEVSGQNFGYHEILQIARSIAGKN